MSIELRHRRGTSAEHATFTGALGEITVDTTDNRAVVHDGLTAGGFPLALEGEVGTATTNAILAGSYCTATTPVSDDAIVLDTDNLTDDISTYIAGSCFSFLADANNLTGSVTVDIDGVGSLAVSNVDGADQIKQGSYYVIQIDPGAASVTIVARGTAHRRNSAVTVDFSSDADVTLSGTEDEYGRITMTDSGAVLTTSRSVLVSAYPREIHVFNDTAQDLTFTTPSGTGTTVSAGDHAKLFVDGTNVVTSDTVVLASGTATFTNSTNNLLLTDVGKRVEVGDVINVTGTASNDGHRTVDVIVDDDNVILNQAHAGGATLKSLTDETVSATVTLLCKWYSASMALGRGWADVTSSRVQAAPYTNPTNRAFEVAITGVSTTSKQNLIVDGLTLAESDAVAADRNTMTATILPESTYSATNLGGSGYDWFELR